MMDVQAMTAIITGAGHEVGRRMAIQLAERGANVGLFDMNASHLAETAAACRWAGVKVAIALGSINDAGSLDLGFAEIEQYLGPVDILINCAHPVEDELRTVHLTCNRDHRTVVNITSSEMSASVITADDVVDAAIWLIDRPDHVQIDGIDLQSSASARAAGLTRQAAIPRP